MTPPHSHRVPHQANHILRKILLPSCHRSLSSSHPEAVGTAGSCPGDPCTPTRNVRLHMISLGYARGVVFSKGPTPARGARAWIELAPLRPCETPEMSYRKHSCTGQGKATFPPLKTGAGYSEKAKKGLVINSKIVQPGRTPPRHSDSEAWIIIAAEDINLW